MTPHGVSVAHSALDTPSPQHPCFYNVLFDWVSEHISFDAGLVGTPCSIAVKNGATNVYGVELSLLNSGMC